MTRLLSTAAALALLLTAAAPAVAQPVDAPVPAPGTATSPAAGAVGVDDGDRLVCRSVRVTGSRFPERECKTKRERAAEQENAKRGVDKFIDRNRRNNVGK
jgi:hypothetical protein